MRDLTAEAAYANRCREALRRMVDGARSNIATGELTWGDRYTAERLGYYLKSLARELADEPDSPPFFGTIAYPADSPLKEHRGQQYYLGRRHISDEIGRPPLVIDWRAPVSTAFYRATASDPLGIGLRRRYGWSDGTLTGFEDERLDQAKHLARDLANDQAGDQPRDQAEAEGVSRLMMAEIERPRVGPMRDIVATIQPEQDELVRAGLEESICVQGAPGTGKTAVGLHRAAYLLYAHRNRLKRNGVLVLGPNRAFLHYISAVLPTLGEVDVEQTTVERLLARGEPRAVDSPGTAVVKHDARMADVLRNALYGLVTKPEEPVVAKDGSYRWRVYQDEFRRIVDDTRREGTAYLVGRERVIARVVAAMRRQAEARGQTANAIWTRKMSRAVLPFVDAVWPAATAVEVLADLLSSRDAIARRADGVLTTQEQEALAWQKPPRSFKSARWSLADVVLLDELEGLLARPDGYGHVIVDEAQDLSPMECRAIARRSEMGSITVLGDLAQGTTAWATRDWKEQLAHLGKPQAEIVALSTGYRVPAEVVALANRLLPLLDVDVPPTRSFRSDGQVRFNRGGTLQVTREALKTEGSIGVIVADTSLTKISDELAEITNNRVTVIAASLVKGLEYDHVIVVEPADIVQAETRGLNRLYVALTRAVSRLDVIYTKELRELGVSSDQQTRVRRLEDGGLGKRVQDDEAEPVGPSLLVELHSVLQVRPGVSAVADRQTE